MISEFSNDKADFIGTMTELCKALTTHFEYLSPTCVGDLKTFVFVMKFKADLAVGHTQVIGNFKTSTAKNQWHKSIFDIGGDDCQWQLIGKTYCALARQGGV